MDDDVVYLNFLCEQREQFKYDDPRLELAKLALINGANPNYRDSYGSSLLMKACYVSNYEMVKILLEYGADPNIINFGSNCLFHIFMNGIGYLNNNTKLIIELLSKYNININFQDENGNTVLILAFNKLFNSSSEHNRYILEIIDVLLNLGLNPNIQNKQGNNSLLLSYSFKYNFEEIIKLLLDYNANLFLTNKLGNTLLINIVMSNDIAKLKTLLMFL